MSCGLAGIEAQPGTRFKLVVKVAKLRPVSKTGEHMRCRACWCFAVDGSTSLPSNPK
jgi:Pyruvate/2-oxoacid:ferredoxin oxidoreductase delta subunit